MDTPSGPSASGPSASEVGASESGNPATPGSGPKVPSRRKFLAGLGVGGAVLGAPAVAAGLDGRRGRPRPGRPDGGGDGRDQRGPGDGGTNNEDDGIGRFIRMFDDEPPFAEPSEQLTRALVELGRPGGLLDAKDPLDVGPIRLITEPELSPNNRDNPTHTAGSTFVGQFLDHDITSDAGSTLGVPTSARRSQNLRSARFDLDSVYGGGFRDSPGLYESDGSGRFRVESGGLFEDLPRTAEGVAIVGDPRNDENLIISGLQASFLKLHNNLMDSEFSGGPGTAMPTRFVNARRVARWHYQWLILNQFLPQFVGQDMVNDVLTNGRRFFTPSQARIPLEFQTSAYRFGHSMIRPSYRANLAGDNGEAFFAFVFDRAQMGQPDPDDLTGRSRAPRRFIGWQTFFDFGDGEVKPNKRIETSISTPMFNLPSSTIASPAGEPIGPTSLATRNLLRHVTWQIPSGQRVATIMGAPQLAPGDLSDVADVDPALAASTPLWLYVLREAGVFADGLHLGPVGGRIVAEVFVGLLQMDPGSYLSANPNWQPTLPNRTGQFTMADMLTFAGVDPVSRGQ